MIRFYCQYSYGGFRTFRINGEADEALKGQEVIYDDNTKENTLDFPQMGSLYFNYGGVKLLYRVYDNGELAIVLREIPGLEKDTDGRPVNCALQIIGQESDKALMDNVVLEIISSLEKFEKDFSEEFSLRGGLHYNGEFLTKFVENLRDKTAEADAPVLEDFASRRGPVYLFVPSSIYFMSDRNLQVKVIRDLRLASDSPEVKSLLDNTISPGRIAELSGTVTFTSGQTAECGNTGTTTTTATATTTDTTTTSSDTNTGVETDTRLQLLDLTRRNETLEAEKQQAERDAAALRRQIRDILGRNARNRSIIYALAAACGALAIGWIISAIL